MGRYGLVLLVILLPLVPSRSAAPPAKSYESWSIDDIVEQEYASGFQFSPDGRYVLWLKSVPDETQNEHVSHLFRTELKSLREVQLTRGKESVTAPKWSPGGVHIAFLSARPAPKTSKRSRPRDEEETSEEHTQLWLMDASGGEPWPLTEGERSVLAFGWIDDETLLFTAQEDATRRERQLKDEKKDGATVVEDEVHEPPIRLFRVEIKSKKVTRFSDNKDRITTLAVSPDGKHAVTIHNRSLRFRYDNKVKPVVYLYDLNLGKSQRILDDPTLNISQIVWAPDSRGFYATHEHSSKPALVMAGVTELLHFDLDKKQYRKLPLDWPRGLATQEINDNAAGVIPVQDGFYALLADGVRYRLARYTHEGELLIRRWIPGKYRPNLFALTATPDGKRVVLGQSTASSPTRWYLAKFDNGNLTSLKEIAKVNESFQKRRMARAELVRWKGARDEEVEGILFYPHGWTVGQRAPLVVQIHGGPASADLDAWEESWAYSANLVCQRGAFVLRLNYHGSTNYGQAWVESISDGKYCDLEVVDIETGVDALIARGLVDRQRLALTGWSNGAILTNALITRTTRYRAAVAGAGSIEYISDWASCEFGEAFDRFYLGKSPLEDLSLYLKKSPFHRLDRVTTPTLILFGEEDRVVHPQQGWAQYRALQQLGKAPVRFVLFPSEKHGLRKLSHQKRKLEEELAWLDRYLFAIDQPLDEIIKKNSPLDWLLQRQQAKRVGSRYGVQHGKILIPETVRHGSILVGRFEVTRAQFAQFRPNYRVEPGQENYPANHISFEDAKAYCAWLSQQTGQTYRLPNEREADELYEKPGEGDNTLDSWAGFAVNLDDADKIRETLRKLPGDAPLLREVGSGRGVGRPQLIYDLGGNAAEWIETKSGDGALRGGSADLPADDRGKGPTAAKNYQGFRVVLD